MRPHLPGFLRVLDWGAARSSAPPHALPGLPALTTRGGGLLSVPSGLGSPASANLKPPPSARKISPPEVPKPEVKKLLILLTPLEGLQKSPQGPGSLPPCWGLSASVHPHMEPGLQAGLGIVPSAILRPCRFHEVPSLSETHM